MKQYIHCDTTYKIKEKVARYVMECGTVHTIYSSDKKFKKIPLFLMFSNCPRIKKKSNLTKITDAFSLWSYWTEPERQAWIIRRQDSKLWTVARRDIDAYQKKMKNKDVLPEVCW